MPAPCAQQAASGRFMMAQGFAGLFLLVPTFCAVSCAQETTMMATGDVAMEVDSTDRDTNMGDTFFVAVKSGANNCYVDALAKSPGQRGEIAFVVKPPPGEGYFVVTIEAKGSISAALAACVREVFGGFYHHADHPAFDSLKGTLTFVPKMIPVPGAANRGCAAARTRLARPAITRPTAARSTSGSPTTRPSRSDGRPGSSANSTWDSGLPAGRETTDGRLSLP